jgi:uncharacterized SAM-binding protein YcdF (DUF218 family)
MSRRGSGGRPPSGTGRTGGGTATEPRRAVGRPRGRRRLLMAAAAVLVFAFVFYLVHAPVLSGLGHLLVASDELEKADAAVVLGGEDSTEAFRVRGGVQLYHDGWVRKVVLSGPVMAYGIPETQFSAPIATSMAVPEADLIVVPTKARSTREEAVFMLPILERQGIRSIYVVSSNFHTRRARRIFIHASHGRMRVLAYPTPSDWFDPGSWWRSRDGRKVFLLEWTKTVNSWLE